MIMTRCKRGSVIGTATFTGFPFLETDSPPRRIECPFVHANLVAELGVEPTGRGVGQTFLRQPIVDPRCAAMSREGWLPGLPDLGE